MSDSDELLYPETTGENYHMPRRKRDITIEALENVGKALAEMDAQEDKETPKCPECLNVLDWRDAMYAGKSGLCKRCHQRDAKRRAQGDFHPAVQIVMRDKKLVAVAVRTNRAQRRHGNAGKLALTETPEPKQHRRTRAERRAVARKAKAAALAA